MLSCRRAGSLSWSVVELNDYLRVLQRRWAIVAIATLLGLAVGFFTSSGGPTPITYTATQTLSVVQPSVNATAPLVSFTPSQLAVYATVGEVPRRAAEELDYPGTPQELAATITAEPDDTVGVLRITATDADGAQAALIANTFGRKLRAVIAGDARDELRTQIADAEQEVDDLQARVNDLDAQLAENPPNVAQSSPHSATPWSTSTASPTTSSRRCGTGTAAASPWSPSRPPSPSRPAGGLSAPQEPARPHGPVRAAGPAARRRAGAGPRPGRHPDPHQGGRRGRQRPARPHPDPVPAPPSPPRAHQRHPAGITVRRGVPQPALHARLRPEPALRHVGRRHRRDDDPARRRPSGRSITSPPSSSSPRPGPTRARPPRSPTSPPATPRPTAACWSWTATSVDPACTRSSGPGRPPGSPTSSRTRTGSRPTTSVMCATSVDGVRLVPAGTPTDNPARLFNRARTLIEASRRQADIVLVDTPPYLVANDAAELIPWVDAVVIVVKSRRTRRGPTERMVENLDRQQAPVVGIVLVGSDDAGSGYSPTTTTGPTPAPTRPDADGAESCASARQGASRQPDADEPTATLTAAGTESQPERVRHPETGPGPEPRPAIPARTPSRGPAPRRRTATSTRGPPVRSA